MKFRNLNQIIELIEKPKNRDSIKIARKNQEKYYLHITGLGLTEWITKIQGLESDVLIKLRKLMGKPVTVPVYFEVLLPTNKVFTAHGGVRFLGLEERKEQSFETILSNVKNGMSINEYMYNIWKTNINLEPSSVAFIEISNKEQSIIPKPYITHKSIFDIYDIEYSGINCEYIIFEPEINKDGNLVYRVVDDEFDLLIIKEPNNTNQYRLDESNIIKNPFNVVPALAYSNRYDTLSKSKISYIHESLPWADEFLNDFTLYTIYKNKLGFPYVAQYPSLCPECMGIGKIDDKTCKRCNGSKIALARDVSDIIIKPFPKEGVPQPGPIAEFISAPIDILQQYEKSQDLFIGRIWKSAWGNSLVRTENEKQQTAFEINTREDSKYTKLEDISTNKEQFEKKMIDLIGSFYMPNYTMNGGSTIIAGRRYMQKSANDLWKEYQDSITLDLANHIKDQRFIEWVYSEYKNQPKAIDVTLKKFRSEPYPHIGLKEISSVNPTEIERQIKKLFEKYIYRFERDVNDLYYTTDEILQGKLYEYAKEDIEKNKIENNTPQEDESITEPQTNESNDQKDELE